MARGEGLILLLLFVSSFYILASDQRTYSFGDLWGGDIVLSAFGVRELVANLSVFENETVVVKVFCDGEVLLTLTVGSRYEKSIVGNNETVSVVAVENVSNITISLINTENRQVTIFGNSTITILEPKEFGGAPLISREQARLYGVAIVVVPILIMVWRSRTRRSVPSREELLEYVGVSG